MLPCELCWHRCFCSYIPVSLYASRRKMRNRCLPLLRVVVPHRYRVLRKKDMRRVQARVRYFEALREAQQRTTITCRRTIKRPRKQPCPADMRGAKRTRQKHRPEITCPPKRDRPQQQIKAMLRCRFIRDRGRRCFAAAQRQRYCDS